MTRAEVERSLGGRPRNALGRRAIIWLPQVAGQPNSAEIAPDSPTIEFPAREDRPVNFRPPPRAGLLDFFPQDSGAEGNQALWISRSVLIAVRFGPDGRLREKYRSTVHVLGPPSVIDWLTSRPHELRRSLGF